LGRVSLNGTGTEAASQARGPRGRNCGGPHLKKQKQCQKRWPGGYAPLWEGREGATSRPFPQATLKKKGFKCLCSLKVLLKEEKKRLVRRGASETPAIEHSKTLIFTVGQEASVGRIRKKNEGY